MTCLNENLGGNRFHNYFEYIGEKIDERNSGYWSKKEGLIRSDPLKKIELKLDQQVR